MPPAFGTFRVLHQIGSGVLGPVFRTYDPQRDRLVAVKAFRLDIVPEQVAKLAESLRRLASTPLNHPNLVQILDAGLEGTTAYLASEYVTAETLDVALRHLAPAPLERVQPLLSQIADAIDAAWAAGVGHGALHPRDVFVIVDTNDVRVSGFGIIPALESIGVKTAVRRPYAAPERIAGETWDIRADVYTLGAIAHELLTRRRPAGPGEQDGALTNSTSAEHRVLIRRVLSAALAERPEHRFGSARALADALGAIVRGEPLSELPEVVIPVAEAEPDAGLKVPATAEETSEDTSEGISEAADTSVIPLSGDSTGDATHSAELIPASEAPPMLLDEDLESPAEATPVHVPSHAQPVWRSTPEHDVAPMFGHTESTVVSQRPWAAIVAAGIAGVMLGLVIGVPWGRRTAVVPPAAAAAAVTKPADTEVPVSPEPPPPRASRAGATAPTENDKKPVAKGPGRIVVRSTPAGAMLLIDGRPHGQTPATVKDVPLGTHSIDVARPGYVPHTERITLSAGRAVRTLVVVLRAGRGAGDAPAAATGTPAAALGSIYVDSRPRGARVMIDGRFVGTSPLRVSSLRPGEHRVELDLTGHRLFSTKVALKASEQARVTATLEERNEY